MMLTMKCLFASTDYAQNVRLCHRTLFVYGIEKYMAMEDILSPTNNIGTKVLKYMCDSYERLGL